MPISTYQLKNSPAKSEATNINSNARIDYIMRFSKQAVLVVDSNDENYSFVGRQFLGNLPEGHNAAFISVSTQLNDIQIRCRLIEQLFSDVLFGPEEPLAVTVLKLSSDTTQPISIVVENVHFLSLQLMHEFCQLVNLAAKADRGINVLLLGGEKAGELVSANKIIFNNKLSIVSGGNGQLIPLDSDLFKNNSREGISSSLIKFVIAIIILVTLSLIILNTLYSTENISVTNPQSSISHSKLKGVSTDIKVPDVLMSKKIKEVLTQDITSNIYQGLSKIGNPQVKVIKNSPPISAESSDLLIVKKTSLFAKKIMKQPQESQYFVNVTNRKGQTKVTNKQNDLAYYLKFNSGFVIQIMSCTKQSSYDLFMTEYKALGFFGYRRLLNSNELMVVTSLVYPLKSDAIAAVSMLPNELQQIGPWIKSIETIKNEIQVHQNNL